MPQANPTVTVSEIEGHYFLSFFMRDGLHSNIHLEDISINGREKDFLKRWAEEKIEDGERLRGEFDMGLG